jgi:hypothetical protein
VTIAGGKIAAGLVLCAIGSAARAQTAVRCDVAPTTALGNAIASANPGAILAITGICQQQVAIASVLQWGLAITNSSGNTQAPLDTGDGIAGQVQIIGPIMVSINGIAIAGPATDQGYLSVVSVLGGHLVITNAQIANGWRNGLVAGAKGTVVATHTTIEGHGAANIAGEADGIRIMQGSALMLGDENSDGTVNAADAVTVTNNAGNGVVALGNSTVTIAGGTIQGNGANQLFLAGAAEASLFGAQVTQTAPSALPANFAIQAMQSSKLLLMQGASVQGGGGSGGALVTSSSSLAMIDSSIANSSAFPTLEASGSSNVLLSGGNTVTNGAPNGIAVEIDHSSSLMQTVIARLSAEFASAPLAPVAAADTIIGAGLIQEQSSMELGVGLVGGIAGLAWTGGITVVQNSAIRLSGGTSISGSVTLGQGSNGFFNVTKGGTNSVVGAVNCPWTAVPSSHLAGAANVSPSPLLAASLTSTTPNQCLPF